MRSYDPSVSRARTPALPATRQGQTGAGARSNAAAVLRLQRAAGNAAVAQLARAPAKRKAPPAKQAVKAPPAKAGKAKVTPLSIAEQHWDRPALAGHAADAYKAGDIAHAVALYERLYELAPDRSVALQISTCYRKLHDQQQAEHWFKVSRGIDDSVPPVESQQF